MKIAIMQPYLFPYIGYFQLINAADKFVVFDDVNYINRGWINRNRILVNKKEHLFTMSLDKASQNKLINEINLSLDDIWKTKLLNTLKMSYSKAPMFPDVYTLINDILMVEERNLSRFIYHSLVCLCQYLGVQTEIIPTSASYNTVHLKGAAKILEICSRESASTYINPIGGQEIYEKSLFEEQDIQLYFLQSNPLVYNQSTDPFIPWLSIIDVMMFNSRDKIRDYLNDYTLITP